MECLLIGGTNDGERVNITPDGIPFWRMPVKARIRDLPATMGNDETAPKLRTEVFHRSTFHTSNQQGLVKDFDLYLLDEMSPAEAMMRLIDGYHRGK